ncbi:Transcription factor iws1 [Claviceps pusilla]|uniref:Transcription factor iws1 n=1 Tax=Claviceps pusilla TaxID=123648 RepID=A0A9P7T0P0_9HYPO|nr:Transcription factor iws1 [Claviceps pusilla]
MPTDLLSSFRAARLAQRQKIGAQFNLTQRPALSARDAERERILAPVGSNNRARMANLPESYTIAPKSTFDGARGSEHRPLGAGGMEAFRRMTQKSKKRG